MKNTIAGLLFGLLIIIPQALRAEESQENLPSPSSSKCGFYVDLEKILNCSYEKIPYLTDYGYKSCLKFQSSKKQWKKGLLTKWVPNTAMCLQQELIKASTLLDSCTAMENAAFGSHPNCYMKNGFCDLNYFDKQKIFNVVAWADIQSRSKLSVAQGFIVNATCDLTVFDIFLHAVNFYFEVTRNMDAVTRRAAAEIFLMMPEDPQLVQEFISGKLAALLTGRLSPSEVQVSASISVFNDKALSLESIFNQCTAEKYNAFCNSFAPRSRAAFKAKNKQEFVKSLNNQILAKRIKAIRNSIKAM
jgi:hypothetical protein